MFLLRELAKNGLSDYKAIGPDRYKGSRQTSETPDTFRNKHREKVLARLIPYAQILF